MLTIRLTRKGKKNQPFFRVVVIDKRRSSKGGRPSEILGYIDPLTKKKSLKKERILYWIKVGAKPSPTVHNLLVSEKIIDSKKINKSKKPKKGKESAPVQAAAPVKIESPAKSPEKVQQPANLPALEPEKPKENTKEVESSAKATEDEKPTV